MASFPGLPTSIQSCLERLIANSPIKLHINCWEKTDLKGGGSQPDSAPLTLSIRHPGVIRSLLLTQDPMVIPEAFLQGLIDVEGKLERLIPVFQSYLPVAIHPTILWRAWLEAWTLPVSPVALRPRALRGRRKHSRDRDQQVIHHHYDVGNAFYRLWLDPNMVYSCAYFADPQMSLVAAQAAKLDLICQKLRLRPGETLLDVGCGWGALLRWAVTHYGVKGYGITLSQEQLAYNQQQIAAAGLQDQLTVKLLDYRDLPQQPTFDKAVSVGMIEHVGIKNYWLYFRSILLALKPGGLFLNHGITTGEPWKGTTFGERFIHHYIFPDGQLATLSRTLSAAEAGGWEVVDVDSWRPHYARTLYDWAKNLDAAADQAIALLGERRFQLWRLYLIGSAIAFENNYQGIYQTLMRRRCDATWNLPMIRSGWLCEFEQIG